MGFQPWVPQQDSNGWIRVVVLLSLLLQVVLIFLGPTRKIFSSRYLRFAVWSCYLLADWVADLALGLLLSNMGVIGGGRSSSPVIFAFWTPFLLLHLGGPDTITAYSLEDNELWLRHLIGFLFELSSVIVIFGCSVRGNPMILATVLILVAGVIKYGERTYSLYRGTTKGFDSDSSSILLRAKARQRQQQQYCSNAEALRLELSSYGSIEARAYYLFCLLRPLFVDMTISSHTLRAVKDFFRGLKPSEAFEMIELELNFMYDTVYTKAAVAHTRAGWVLRFICSGCIVSALAIFLSHDKGGMKHIDVGITYTLLLGALALDVAAMAMLLFSDRAAVFLQESRWFNWLGRLTSAARMVWRPRCWSETYSQLNFISDCLDMPRYHSTGRWWFVIAKLRSVAEKLQDLIFIRHMPVMPLNDLRDLIFPGAKADEDECARDDGKLIEVCNSRGERVLERFKGDIRRRPTAPEDWLIMTNSVKKSDFDASLLMWHIATDICLLDDDADRWIVRTPTDAALAQSRLIGKRRRLCKTVSEYLLYLLVKQSEMVSAKGSVWLSRCQDTSDHLTKEILEASEGRPNNVDHNGVRRLLLEPIYKSGGTSVLGEAISIAKVLRGLEWGLMWEVMSGVWMEMLTYTATKCRATTHVRQLNRGGELITLVWLLREQMGLGELAMAAFDPLR